MGKPISASICFSDLAEKAKAGHSAFSRAKNGKVYVNLAIWTNDEPDKFGNDVSIQLNSSKDKKQQEGTVYIGNGRTPDFKPKDETPAVYDRPKYDDNLPF